VPAIARGNDSRPAHAYIRRDERAAQQLGWQSYSARRHDDGLAWVDELGTAPLEFQPGERWAYSALAGFDVLSRSRRAGLRTWTSTVFLRERIFEPLGMRETFFWPDATQRERLAGSYVYNGPNGLSPRPNPDSMSSPVYYSAAGGLMTTAADYARFALMLANRGALDGATHPEPTQRRDPGVVDHSGHASRAARPARASGSACAW
jgi:CubicO group peptidase (beta-lactamase class C family)